MIRFRVYEIAPQWFGWTLFRKGKAHEYLGYGKAPTKRQAEEEAIRAIREMET